MSYNKTAINTKNDGYTASRIKKTLEDQGHQMSIGCLYDLTPKHTCISVQTHLTTTANRYTINDNRKNDNSDIANDYSDIANR